MIKLKKNLISLKRRRSGSTKIFSKKALYLDRNEKNIVLDISIKKNLINKILGLNLGFYPDFINFYKKLSTWSGVKSNEVFLTEGVSGGIKNLLEVYTDKSSNIIIPDPTFAMYDVYAKMFNVKAKKYEYDKNFNLNYKKVIDLIDKNTSIIFLPCPNIPIDSNIDEGILKKILILAKRKKIVVALDEVYFMFSKFNGLKYFKQYKNNIVILRSFSKAFGLAGIRLGYLISSSKNIEYISKVRTGYESNVLSMKIAEYFMSNLSITNNYISDIKNGLKYFKEELMKIGIQNFGGLNSNYIFINFSSVSFKNKIYKIFIKNKIFVRTDWSKPFHKGFLISGSSKNNMKKIILLLKKNNV